MLLLPIRSAEPANVAPLPAGFTQIQRGPYGGSVWQGRIANTYEPKAWRPTIVYLPPAFDSQARYPVVFLLQGFRGSPYQYIFGLDLAARADRLIAAHDIAPFIAVIPAAGLTARYDGEWTGAWEDYVVDDVVPWANRQLPLASGMQARVIAGLSAGGYGAVDIGLRHPRLFGTLESWSGSFSAPHDGSLSRASSYELANHDPRFLVLHSAPLIRRLGTRFFLSCGLEDRALARGTASFARELESLRITHRLLLSAGDHNSRFWSSQLAPALAYALPNADAARA